MSSYKDTPISIYVAAIILALSIVSILYFNSTQYKFRATINSCIAQKGTLIYDPEKNDGYANPYSCISSK